MRWSLGWLAVMAVPSLAFGQVPTMKARDARAITQHAVLDRAHMPAYLLRTDDCRRRTRTSFRCTFTAGGDVGEGYSGHGVVRWTEPAAGGLRYDLAVTRFVARLRSDGSLEMRTTGHFRWRL